MSDQSQVTLKTAITKLTPQEQALHNNFTTSYRNLARDLVRTAYYLWQIQERCIHKKLGFASLAGYARSAVGLSPAQTRDFVLLARNLPRYPEVESALTKGHLSWSQARLITRRVEPQEQTRWIRKAQNLTVKQLEEVLPSVRRQGATSPDKHPAKPRAKGEKKISGNKSQQTEPAPLINKQYVTLRFTPESYSRFERILACTAGADREEKILNALAGVANRNKTLPYLLVIMNCPTCGIASLPTSRGEAPIPAALLDAAHCDGAIEDASGARKQVVPPRLRRLALQRSRYCCEAQGCTHTQYLEIHHRLPMALGGNNDSENLVVLCWHCHRQLHEQEMAANSALRLTPI